MGLKNKSLNALFWSYLDSFGVYFVRFGFTIAIARQLSPRDYGLSGMIAIFIALATLITEGGFSMALIQKKDSSQKDYSTVFFFNLAVSIFLYLILYLLAGSIANFYNEPIIKEITRVASLSIILSALITVQITILNKKLEFKIPAFIRMSSALLSGIVGVILAYNGYGVWALVYPTLIGSVLSTVSFWTFNKWRPSFLFSIESFESLYKYGINVFAQGFTSIVLDQIYYPLIGKFYSTSELGYFSNANRFYQIFVRRITIAYGRVAFPAFSSIQTEAEIFATAYKKTFISLAFILLPFTAFLIVSARPVMLFLLTDKWEASISYLQLLYIDGFFFPLLLLNQNVLNALGKSKISLIIDTTKKISVLVGLIVVFKFGIHALIISQVLSTAIGLLVSVFFVRKNIAYFNLLRELFPIIILTVLFAIIAYSVSIVFTYNIVIILMQTLVFIIYIIVNKYLHTKGYHYFTLFIKPVIPKYLIKYI